MKLTLTIESQDPAEIARAAQALAGVDFAPSAASAAEVKTPPRTTKKEVPAEQPKSPPQETAAVQKTDTAAQASAQGQTQMAGAVSPSEAVDTGDAAIMSAVNAAAAKLGAEGPSKLRDWIKTNFGGLAAVKGADEATKIKFLADIRPLTDGTAKL